MFTDELFQASETNCFTFMGLWYGQEKLEDPALLILIECYTINICAADISWKVISLQLKEYTSTEWQFHVVQIVSQSLPQPPAPSLHTTLLDPLYSVITHKGYIHVARGAIQKFPKYINKTCYVLP
jgi:hypothetical protein